MKTSEVIQLSIEKWEAIAEGTGTDDRCDNCPLCQKFLNLELKALGSPGMCGVCPIKLHTGKDACEKTPYSTWLSYIFKSNRNRKIVWPVKATTPHLKNLARKEVNFLKHILKLHLEKENEID